MPETSSQGPTFEDLARVIERVEEAHTECLRAAGSDVFESARVGDETRAEAKSRVFQDLIVNVWGSGTRVPRKLSADVLDAGEYATYRLPGDYATGPQEYVQGLYGGGRPYDTHRPSHFVGRYGSGPRVPDWQRVWLGVFKDVPRRMAEHEAQDRAGREAYRLLSPAVVGDSL